MPATRNVLLIVNDFEIGGAEGQILLLARLLLEGGKYRPHLACLRRKGALLPEAERLELGDIPQFPLTSFYDRNMIVQLRRFGAFVRERKIDVIHTEGFYTNIFGITGAKLAGVQGRVAFRGETSGWRTKAQDFTERQIFRLASVIHANSEAVRRYLLHRGVADDRIAVVYNGLDLGRLAPPNLTRPVALANIGLPNNSNTKYITMVANMKHEVKDYPMFLRAARRVASVCPEAGFVLAGDGDLAKSLRNYARELGIESKTFFIGMCHRIPELLFASDVCVLSSRAEGFSNSILEYMGASRPVVATDVGGASEQIAAGESGYLVSSGDDKSMAERIISLLQQPKQARAMGIRGRQIVEQRFSSEVQREKTQELYDRVLSK